jgi:hypothetical protein
MSAAVHPNDPKTLAVAVIAQAFFDLRDVLGGVQIRRDDHTVGVSERFEAVHFLTDVAGGWAEARALWAELADLNPDHIRDQAVAEINAPPPGKRQPSRPGRQVRPPHPDTRAPLRQES